MPHLQDLYEKYGREDLEVVVIDVKNMKESTSKMAQEASLSVPVLLDDNDVADNVYDITYTPTTFIVGPEGKAVFKHVGFGEGHRDMLEKEITLLLERRPT